MGAVHAFVGVLTFAVAVVLLIWNGIGLVKRGTSKKGVYRILVGLLDLQVLLGIITFVIHPRGGAWLLHPIIMLITVGIAHVFTKDSRPVKQQLFGYVAVVVLLLVGIFAASI